MTDRLTLDGLRRTCVAEFYLQNERDTVARLRAEELERDGDFKSRTGCGLRVFTKR